MFKRFKCLTLNYYTTVRKIFSHWTIQISQNQGPISSPLSKKNTITFALFWIFFAKKGAWSQLQRLKSKCHLPFAVSQPLRIFQSKKFGSSTFQFCGYRQQRSFFKNFNPQSFS